jgi:hypothetical protein
MRQFAAIAMSAILCSCISHQPVTPEVRGIVIDSSTGKSLGGAEVELNYHSRIITEDDGIFYFPQRKGLTTILPATHRMLQRDIIILKPGYYPVVIRGYTEDLYSPVSLTRKAAEQGAAANP